MKQKIIKTNANTFKTTANTKISDDSGNYTLSEEYIKSGKKTVAGANTAKLRGLKASPIKVLIYPVMVKSGQWPSKYTNQPSNWFPARRSREPAR